MSAAPLLAVGAFRAVPVSVIVLVLVVLFGQLARVRRTPRAAPWSAASIVGRGIATGTVLCVVVLHVLAAERAVIDVVLACGLLGAVLAATAAALLALTAALPRTLVVGDAADLSELLGRWAGRDHLDVVATRRLDETSASPVAEVLPGPRLPSLPASIPIAEWAEQHGIDLVLVASGTGERAEEVRRLGWSLERSTVDLVVVDTTRFVSPHRLTHQVVDGTTMTLVGGSTTAARWVKTAGDRIMSAALLLVLLPLITLMALAVRLDSRGPAIFRQTRIGRDGRPFTLVKMRTMSCDAEELKAELVPDDPNDLLFKIRVDPRVTRVGRFLRASSLDELPQLWNVVRGEMSLVGPRPALPEEVDCYSETERRRLAVKPGLTGPWQVGGRSLLSRERSMQLDVGYADNWNTAGDVRILLRTIDAVITRRGAF